MEKRFLTVAEIAEYLGFKQSAIRKWIRLGKIPFNRLNGGIRFDLRLIDQWAQKRQEQVQNN